MNPVEVRPGWWEVDDERITRCREGFGVEEARIG